MLYYLAPYLSLPAASVNVCTGLVAICPASARVSRETAGTPPESLSRPVSYLVPADVMNSTEDILTHPFGYPYSSKFYRATRGPDEAPKKILQIRNPSQAWALTDADQQNAYIGGLYFDLIPQKKVHRQVRNQLCFDWHVEAVK